MKGNKSLLIGIAVTLLASVGISALVFKPMGTVATEKNNAELYLEMKEQAKSEVQSELQSEFDLRLQEEIKNIKDETNMQIQNLKSEYDKAIADAKLQQANQIQAVVEETQNKIDQATSFQAIEDKRKEEAKKDPNYSEEPPTAQAGVGKEPEGIKIQQDN